MTATHKPPLVAALVALFLSLGGTPAIGQSPGRVTAINPASRPANSGNFEITVDVSGVIQSQATPQVVFGSTPLQTRGGVTQTRFVGSVPNSLIQEPGPVPVYVQVGLASFQPLFFEITPRTGSTPQITGLSPSSRQANSGNFTLTISGSGLAAGPQVIFGSTTLTPSSASTTSIGVTVSNNLIQTSGSVPVRVRVNNVDSNTLNFTVTPAPSGPQLTGLTPSSRQANTGDFTLTINGTGFNTTARVIFGTATLTPSNTTATSISVPVTNNLIQTVGTVPVRVRLNNTESNAVGFTVTPPPGGPLSIRITAPAEIPSPTTNIGVVISSGAPSVITGTLSLTFSPNASGLPAGYRDPAQAWASGGTSISFTIQPGQSAAVLPNSGALNIGTVAGTLRVIMDSLTQGGGNALPDPKPETIITIFRRPPVIVASSARIVSVNGGLNVEVQGYSSTRDLQRALFQFEVASNALAQGSTSFNIDLTFVSVAWFNSTNGRNAGSRFLLIVPFTTSADPSLVRSVAVSLTNSAGDSGSVSATR
ncbi:MAG: hypothetical protein ACKV22_41365 [Bryobacteraceae bacterium]